MYYYSFDVIRDGNEASIPDSPLKDSLPGEDDGADLISTGD